MKQKITRYEKAIYSEADKRMKAYIKLIKKVWGEETSKVLYAVAIVYGRKHGLDPIAKVLMDQKVQSK